MSIAKSKSKYSKCEVMVQLIPFVAKALALVAGSFILLWYIGRKTERSVSSARNGGSSNKDGVVTLSRPVYEALLERTLPEDEGGIAQLTAPASVTSCHAHISRTRAEEEQHCKEREKAILEKEKFGKTNDGGAPPLRHVDFRNSKFFVVVRSEILDFEPSFFEQTKNEG